MTYPPPTGPPPPDQPPAPDPAGTEATPQPATDTQSDPMATMYAALGPEHTATVRLLMKPVSLAVMEAGLPSSLGSMLIRSGMTAVRDVLADPPDSFDVWAGERDLAHAASAARSVATWRAEQERLALNDKMPDVAAETMVFVEGSYVDHSRAMLDSPMGGGRLRTAGGVLTALDVPARFGGARVWMLAEVQPGDRDVAVLNVHAGVGAPAETYPRWRGMTPGQCLARFLLNARLLEQLRTVAGTEEDAVIAQTLSLVYTPRSETARRTGVGEVDAMLAAMRRSRAWQTVNEVLERAGTGTAGRAGGLPDPRMVKGHAEAEAYAAEVLAGLGFADVRTTLPGADGGIDVIGAGVVAQVKMEANPTGRDRLQALYGVATVEGCRPVFFSLAGYTAQAVTWADQAGVGLLEFAFNGEIAAANGAGERLLRDGAG